MSGENRNISDCIKRDVRAVLLSCKDGIKLENFEKDFFKLTGSYFVPSAFGYDTLLELFYDIPSVCRYDIW